MISLTYAETALFRIIAGMQVEGRKILVAGNRTGALPLELAKRGADVKAHMFDFHHYRTVRDRFNAAGVTPNERLFCTPNVPEGPFDMAFFQTTPQSMSAELVLDQLQDVYAQLAEGAALYAAFEGDGDDAFGTVRKVFAKAGPVVIPPPEGMNKAEEREFKRFLKHVAAFRCVKKGEAARVRNFSCEWEASVPGGDAMRFTSLPGCFAHRRADAGGLALAEIAAREAAQMDALRLVDMGCGCGLVGILAAAYARKANVPVERLRFIDSHARAIAAARMNVQGLFDEAEFMLSDDGTPRGETGGFNMFVGNPPYYSEYKIAETFIETAYRALDKGGVCLSVVKRATALKALQEKYFGKAEIIPRRGYEVLKSVR
ncbi:MAG: methyltransferase [Kiritimatiellae bacterium]|nr:methyltransferase [Kiritimatiellia bacterium]